MRGIDAPCNRAFDSSLWRVGTDILRMHLGAGLERNSAGLMKRIFAIASVGIFAAAGCQGPTAKVVECLPPPAPEPLVRAPGTFGRAHLPQPRPQPARPQVMDNERAWTPPGGFSNAWRYIIIHHSGDERSTPAGIDAWHRQRGWDEMGYHFVIGNGVGYEDGRVFVGPRWPKQKHGAHTRVSKNDDNRWNLHGIGICLVGNLENHPPTPKQMASLARLAAFLSGQCGIAMDNITTHGEVDSHTKCPGRHLSLAGIRQRVATAKRNGTVQASAN